MILTLCLFLCATLNVVKPIPYYDDETRFSDYDYIIVGAGSSGSVIAERLSESPNVTVLLLEAGGFPPDESQTPLYVGKLSENNKTDWGYYTVPQNEACLGLPGKKSFWTRYKALGGCSGHNYMVYNRGNSKDYDSWQTMGATGWGWKSVLPFFKKSENHQIKKNLNNGYHGTSGPLTVSAPQYETRLRAVYIEAMKSLGYKEVDYNGPSQTGVSEIQLTQRDGLRCSTEKAFLRPNRNRPNLDILTNARALKIEFDESKVARRVVYDHQGKTVVTSALKEIILSAGAIGSPQLLMLSGVGPKQELEDLNIPLVADVPGVGQNLQDHISIGGLIWKLNDSIALVLNRDVNDETKEEFKHSGKGPLTSPGTLENMIYASSKFQNASEDWPDMHIQTASTAILISLPEYANQDVTTITPVLPRPKSRGSMKLKTRDPYDKPILDPRYLSDPQDLLTLVEEMKFSRKIMKTPAFQRYDPQPILEAVPDCKNLDFESDEYMACTIRSLTLTYFHPCCTAKMGQTSDKTTVVDPQLRVKGVKNLRVADASIMPVLPSANTNAACIMIGEKAADMIKSSAEERN